MIAALVGGYLGIGALLAAIAARRARALELVAMVVAWPLVAPLWLERPAARADRMGTLEAALERVGQHGAEAPAWMARIAAAERELDALDRALAEQGEMAASPVIARAREERRRRQEALATIDRIFVELGAQVRLASWVDDADGELRRLLAALAERIAVIDPGGETEVHGHGHRRGDGDGHGHGTE